MPRFLVAPALALLFALCGFMTAAAVAQSQPASEPLAIVGATVLPMTGAERLPDQTILIRDGRIETIGPRAAVRVPDGYRRIEGNGRFVMPGLVDMHVHLANETGQPGDAAQRALAVMLAHGVTTARSMAGGANHPALRKAIEAGDVAGPQLYLASPPVNLKTAATPGAARQIVADAKAAGFDLIKAHHIEDVAVWAAMHEEAARQAMPVAGHVTNSIGLLRAVAAGQQIEHLDGTPAALLADDGSRHDLAFGQIPPPSVLAALGPQLDQRLPELARELAAARSYQVPTLALFEKIADVERDPAAAAADPAMRYVPDAALAAWTQQAGTLRQAGFTPADGAALRDLRRRIVREYAAAGVPIMAGSDTAQAFHIWGPGLVDEVEALVRAGLTPLQALQSATVVPRDYFRSLPNAGSARGRQADFGTVEPGARADLIILRSDPLRDVAALRQLDSVIAGGMYRDRAALDRLLDQAAADAKRPASAAALAQPVFVLRHLETGEGADPSLTATGKAQAEALARQLGGQGITAIYATDTRRARETAAPLAAALGLRIEPYDPRSPDALIAAIRQQNGTAVIIGHSNTVPDIITRLGGTAPPALRPGQFGDLWQVGAAGATRHFAVGGTVPARLSACSIPGLPPAARCGSILVPEDRGKPGGRSIPIHFGIIPATGKSTQPPLAVLPGGPGLGGLQDGPGTEQLFTGMLDNRDLLLIDQRGTGRSNRLACPLPADSGDALARLGGTDPVEVIACRAELEKIADLTRYTTRQAVLDMEEVRAALGIERLDLFGMSYGTRPALDYLRLYPDRVGHTVIRAAAPSQMLLPLWTPRDAQASYDTLVRYCQAQPACAARHPDLAANLDAVVAQLERGPADVAFTDPRTGTTTEAKLTREGFSSVLFFLLYIPEFYVNLPPLMEQAAAGNFVPMVQATAPFLLGVTDAVAWGLRWSVICDEDVRRIDAASVGPATQGTFMGAEPVRGDMEACALWPRAQVPADYLAPVASDKPVLVISGEMDPVAGKVWGEEVMRTLTNARHLEVAGASHLPPLPGCTPAIMKAFLAGTAPAELDATCIAASVPPQLKVGGR